MATTMTAKDKKYWKQLYAFVKEEIFRYDEQPLPRYCIQRIKSLQYGQFLHNSKSKNNKIIYSLALILYTFKVKKSVILYYIDKTEFTDERHMINGIIKIVEGSINDSLKRLRRIRDTKKDIQNQDIAQKNETNKATYKTQSKKISKDTEDIW